MHVGILKEVKIREGRVALTPEQVKKLTDVGHVVSVESKAGEISGFSNDDYAKAGAQIAVSKKNLLKNSELILKVKEPTSEELCSLSSEQILFCYLHLASQPDLLHLILKKKLTVLGYETLELPDHSLPLLKPMSEIAGKLAVQNGAEFLKCDRGGRGVLLGGTENVRPGKVLILGAGVVGSNAAKIAVGLGAETWITDKLSWRLKQLKKLLPQVEIISEIEIEKRLLDVDLLIGAVLISGERTPKIITEKMVQKMRKGSVIVDVSVDQGGCVATSEVTTHENPILIKHGVLHYGVSNMPGSVPFTATKALSQATFPYVLKIAKWGLVKCLEKFPEMKLALNCRNGHVTHPGLQKVLSFNSNRK